MSFPVMKTPHFPIHPHITETTRRPHSRVLYFPFFPFRSPHGFGKLTMKEMTWTNKMIPSHIYVKMEDVADATEYGVCLPRH